jgi:hypothetical protein
MDNAQIVIMILIYHRHKPIYFIIVHLTEEKTNFLRQAHSYPAMVPYCFLWCTGNKRLCCLSCDILIVSDLKRNNSETKKLSCTS